VGSAIGQAAGQAWPPFVLGRRLAPELSSPRDGRRPSPTQAALLGVMLAPPTMIGALLALALVDSSAL
jgi:hypothetical protein